MIRAATPGDAAPLARVIGDWVRETGWMPMLHTRDEDIGFLAHLIATQEVTVAGDCEGFLARDGERVTALYLSPAARGRGHGRALLDGAKAGRGRLDLWTFEANLSARRFYAREGFSEVGRTGGDNAEGLPDLRLEWRAA